MKKNFVLSFMDLKCISLPEKFHRKFLTTHSPL